VVSTSRHVRWYPRTSPSENRSAVSPHEPAFAARAPLETRALEHGSAVFADVAAAAPTDDLLEGSDLHEARTRWIGCRDGCERVALEPAPRRPARRVSALEPVDGVCLESVLRHASRAHPRGPLVHPTEGRAACRRTGDGRSSPPKVGNTRLALSIAECTKSSGNKFPGPPSGFGLNKRLNRRFRKQHGGPLLEGDASRSGRPLGPPVVAVCVYPNLVATASTRSRSPDPPRWARTSSGRLPGPGSGCRSSWGQGREHRVRRRAARPGGRGDHQRRLLQPGRGLLRRLPPARPGVDLRAADLEAQEPDGHPSRGDPLDKNADVGAITFNRFDPAYLLADTRNPASAAREDDTASCRTWSSTDEH